MKFSVLLAVCSLSILSGVIHAVSEANPQKNRDAVWLQQIRAPKITSYISTDAFNFDSTKGILFNRYHGQTNAYVIGADNIKIASFSTGLYFTNYLTDLQTSTKLGPLRTESTRATYNRGFNLHATKNLIENVRVDVFGGYGQSAFNLSNTLETERLGMITGYSKYQGHDALAGFRGLYTYSAKHFLFQSDVGYFYARFNQPAYVVFYPQTHVGIPKLITSVGTYLENAKLSYFINDYFSPFVNGALIQVGSRSFSRPVASISSAAAPLPDLVIAKNGYAYGGGLMFKYKKILLSASYKHENRQNQFLSDTYLLKMDWLIHTI